MGFNREDYIKEYLEELGDNIQTIDKGILNLKKNPDNEELLNSIARSLHTVKGTSGMLDFPNMEKLSHSMENVFKHLKEQSVPVSSQIIQLIFIGTDYLKYGGRYINKEKTDTFFIDDFIEACEFVCLNKPFKIENIKTPFAEAEEKETAQIIQPLTQGPAPDSIRIKISTIDKMIQMINELIIKQFQFKKDGESIIALEEKIEYLQAMLGDLNESKKLTHLSQIQQIDKELLKNIKNVKKNFFEKTSLQERVAFKLQENIFGLRMLPLEMILSSLEKMIHDNAIKLNKEIDFQLIGSDVKIDKAILEKINDPIIHIVRNAVDHGIEMPDEREKDKKRRAGTITIHCFHEGGNIIIKIKDDGRGLNFKKIKEKALRLKLANPEQVNQMSEQELTNFLFSSGFSTADQVTKLSGRGVGLDIVKTNIEKIKGKITLNSETGKGTEFILYLPLSLATVEGFFVEEHNKKFLIPSLFVKEIVILKDQDKLELMNNRVFKYRNKIIPLFDLSTVLKLKKEKEIQHNFIIVTEANNELIGIAIESIVEYTSLIFKPLPRNLQKIRCIQGIVFDETFNLICILHIPGLIDKIRNVGHAVHTSSKTQNTQTDKTILVVDDSLHTREIEKSILELENYKVITASDGIDAIQKLKTSQCDLIITDINMPRMNGLEMIKKVKSAKQFTHTPIIIVSTQEDEKTKKAGKNLGADAFIVKSQFDRNNLIDEVKKLIG
ncbi:MAG: hybrid sensor histidine kinase/response regulator [Spirochaetes bacterium]|nr:hybrid sensor histidine kinase/response regulator [Spirochaetota bacterium]